MTGCLGTADFCHLSRRLAPTQGGGSDSKLTTHIWHSREPQDLWHPEDHDTRCSPPCVALTLTYLLAPSNQQDAGIWTLLTLFATTAKWSFSSKAFLNWQTCWSSRLPLWPSFPPPLSLELGLKRIHWFNFISMGTVLDSSLAKFIGLFLSLRRFCLK